MAEPGGTTSPMPFSKLFGSMIQPVATFGNKKLLKPLLKIPLRAIFKKEY
jgi:hypothetical protein